MYKKKAVSVTAFTRLREANAMLKISIHLIIQVYEIHPISYLK